MPAPPRGTLVRGLLWLGAVVGVADLVFVRASVPSLTQTLVYAGVISVMLVAMGWAIVRRPLWARTAWSIILVVLSLHVVGLLVRQFTQGGRRSGSLATAGAADVLFAVAYGTALLALLLMVRQVKRRPEPLWLIDAVIAFTAVWTIGAEIILVPLAQQGAGLLPLGIQAFYLTVNAGLVGVGVRLGLTSEPGVNRAMRIGLVGVAIFAINDIVSTSGLITGTQVGLRNGIYAAANVIAISMMSAAACDPTAVNPPARSPHVGRLSARRSVAAVTVVAVVAGSVAYQLNREPHLASLGLFALVIGLMALLAWRSVAIVRAYQQVVEREETLRAATASMTATETTGDLDASLSRAVTVLLPQDQVTWSWATREMRQGEDPDGAVGGDLVTIGAPVPATPQGNDHYVYRDIAVDGEDVLETELITDLLLDPLDWTGVQSLATVAVQARSRQRLRQEREQSAEAARLSAMLAGAQDMVVLLDPDHTISLSLGAVDELTGRSADSWAGRPVTELFVDAAPIVAAAESASTRRRRVEARIAGGGAVVEATVVRFAGGEVSVSLHDVTERLELNAELDYRAHHDLLTGLPNRAMLERFMRDADRQWQQQGCPFAIAYIDVDDFKLVNDSLGHRLGDALLIALAERFTGRLGDRGTVARLGGDEFAVLLPGATIDEALPVAAELIASLAAPVVIEGVEILLRASAGVAASEDATDDGEFVLHAADLALYDARDKGKGNVAQFRAELKDEAARKLHEANAVAAAVREKAFRFDYQPIVDVGSGTVLALEALMRWDRGQDLRRPDSFIPIAESLGELTRMLRDVVPSALDQLSAWRRDDPNLLLAINFHSGALIDREFMEWFVSALTERNLPPSSVIVEVSERSIVPRQADLNLSQLRIEGIPIWIDDFGTGWSNLSSLERLPVTGIKLARELVIDGRGAVKSDLVRAVRSLADAVGFSVTAEGVETPEQLSQLAELGITIVQGYLVARPMKAVDAQEWLAAYRDGPAGVAEG